MAQQTTSPQNQTDTRSILETLLETVQIGASSFTEVERQNEVLYRAEADLAEMHDDLNRAERSLENMDSFWNRVVNFFSADNGQEFSNNNAKIQAQRDTKNAQIQKEIWQTPTPAPPPSNFSSIMSNKATDASTMSEKMRYLQQQDDDLDQIHDALGDLKKLAGGLHNSIESSNHTLTRMNNQTNLANERVAKNAKFAVQLTR